jgi:hypothetical protein
MENNTIAALADIVAIKNMKGKYCRMVDTKQWEELAKLIAPSPELIFKSPEGEVLHAFYDSATFVESCQFIQAAKTVHHVHAPEIKILSDTTAQGIWAMEDQFHFPAVPESPFKTFHGYGHYYETYEKVGGEWKIKTIRLERIMLNIENFQ